MRLGCAIIGCGIILVLIGFRFAHAGAVQGSTNPSAASVQSKVSSENNPVHRVELDIASDSYFAGSEGRGVLKYLVRCALDAGTEARLSLPDEKLTFMGGAGLAPEWAGRALTRLSHKKLIDIL